VDFQEQEFERLRAKLRSEGGQTGAYRSFRKAAEAVLLPHQLKRMRQILHRYPCYCHGVFAHAASDGALGSQKLRAVELANMRHLLKQMRSRYRDIVQREWEEMHREILQMLTAEQRHALDFLANASVIRTECPIPEIIVLQLESRHRRSFYRDLKAGFAEMGESAEFHLQVDGSLKMVERNSPVEFVVNLTRGMDEAEIVLDRNQRWRLRQFTETVANEMSERSIALRDQVEAGQVSVKEAAVALRPISNKLAVSALEFFETDLLSAEEFRRLQRMAVTRALFERGLLSALLSRDLGNALQVTKPQKERLEKLADQRCESLAALLRQMGQDIWGKLGNTLDADHRRLWTDRYGSGGLSIVRTAPSLLLYAPPAK
jgi:hypothetical protein